MFNNKIIKVHDCGNDNILTPLIWTFKFDGVEYWCPRCGYVDGMLGAGKDVKRTPKLEASLEYWKKKSKSYLSGETDEWEYEL